MADGICSADGCGRRGRLVRGWCSTHYSRWRRTGTADDLVTINAGKRCSVTGCDSPACTRGWCGRHYQRWRATGSTDAPGRPGRPRCSVSVCPSTVVARGYCDAHYYRWRAYGDPLGRPRVSTAAERFWSHVDKNGPVPGHLPELGPCWIWTAATNPKGYGCCQDSESGRVTPAHRMSWRLAIGPVPHGLWILHHCDNPPCVRPDHLFPGTAKDNTQDMIRKGRHYTQR